MIATPPDSTEAGVDVSDADLPTVGAEDTLTAVGESTLRLLAGFPAPPSALRIRVGDVSIEAEWSLVGGSGSAVQPAPSAAPAIDMSTGNGSAGSGSRSNGSAGNGSGSNGVAPAVTSATPPSPPDPAGRVVAAHMVGVFYRAPEPGAPPFVEVGTRLKVGDQVGILEAMKLMVPVHADEAGTVTEILKANGEAVEYGEPLIAYVVA